MAQVTALLIKELRESTGAGMMDCKKALKEVDGDLDKATQFLRKKGLAKAAKKAGRVATEGVVHSYIHANKRIGVLVEINCETDFVGKTEELAAFAADVAMQIAAMNPECVRREEMDTSSVEKERTLLKEKALQEGKPEKIIDKIVDGQINKFYGERVLLEQAFVKENKKTILQIQQELVAKLGENIQIRRFARYELGEGMAKKVDDFAAEVAAQVKGT
ncbi:MAG: translation elongation factor Ts [Nannocystaceae bacterium]|nr:translation elongation factor Ts [Nannocystaceae bacterium]